MADSEKVFEAFRNCITEPKCKDCPWEQCEQFNQKKVSIPATLALVVLNLLKDEKEYCDKCAESAIKTTVELQEEIARLRSLLKEQEAKNGEWITIWQEDDPDTSTCARCSICNRISGRPLGGYCRWCGTKMTL